MQCAGQALARQGRGVESGTLVQQCAVQGDTFAGLYFNHFSGAHLTRVDHRCLRVADDGGRLGAHVQQGAYAVLGPADCPFLKQFA